jgi:hypothetical protein
MLTSFALVRFAHRPHEVELLNRLATDAYTYCNHKSVAKLRFANACHAGASVESSAFLSRF